MIKLTNEMMKLLDNKVLYIVNKYAQSYNKEDLLQAGKMGIVKASLNYDENVGVKFSTFCEKYILGEILKYIREDKNIKVSRDFIKIKKKIDIARQHYFMKKGTNVTIEELSNIINEPINKIKEVLNFDQNVKSIYSSIDNDNELIIEDTIAQEERIDKIDLINLKEALESLSTDDKKLILERYYNGKSQTELANEMNISQVKVYRMERKILDDLNDRLVK